MEGAVFSGLRMHGLCKRFPSTMFFFFFFLIESSDDEYLSC